MTHARTNDPMKEVARLRDLLSMSGLRPAEKQEILRQLELLQQDQTKKRQPEPRRSRLSRYTFGIFDRPAPRPEAEDNNPEPTQSSDDPPFPPKPAPPLVQNETPTDASPELPSAAEIEELARQIADIVDRIIWLRAYWATTLSDDVSREEGAWHKKLHELAARLKAIAPDALELAVGGHANLLSQNPRDPGRPSISPQLQERVMPSTIPSSMAAQIKADFYRMLESARRPVVEKRDPTYIPDGLQSLVT